jgi:hypothetical protein
MRFKREEMIELISGGDVGGVELVSDVLVGTTRWSNVHQIIFKVLDTYYRAEYCTGATEYQDERPWDGQDEVEAEEVRPVPTVVINYEAVK